ncbi:hypothetical protein H6P81_018127 [Aristolochia fimbriata]|uniref:Uncharacterized protein n=1 Tax=Aristolochia fimbriata TaxID=158543 RepID=A0AAV7E0X7_ARIFI|nr:hypothetical protein H6P81_018127 [Aristolochia fimbriata]
MCTGLFMMVPLANKRRVFGGFFFQTSVSLSAMAFLFQKFQEFIKTLAKSPTFARDPRLLQFEADVNRLFLYTSYNRLGNDVAEADTEEIIELASKASLADQQKQVQENIHSQIKSFCSAMDEVLRPSLKSSEIKSANAHELPRRSGLTYAIGRTSASALQSVVPETQPLSRAELSHHLKDRIGYTLDIKPSQIPHKDAGQGLYLHGEANVGAVIAFYPGVIYSPAYYKNIPGYPRVDAQNSYLITRYDGIVINGQPWGLGGEAREVWDGYSVPQFQTNLPKDITGNSDKLWKWLGKTSMGIPVQKGGEVLERRNPLAFGHFANHPAPGTEPNVMLCPYDFPMSEADMRAYIPNVVFGSEENVKMRRFGSFWFKSGGTGDEGADVPLIKTLLLVATKSLCDEEVFLNYRLSNAKRRPAWYMPVDEEEDKLRWS